jgi:hypothetical protein
MAVRTEEGADPNAQWTVLIGIVGAILTFAIIVALQVLFHRVNNEEIAQKKAMPNEDLVRIRTAQLEHLNSYRYLDQTAGRVAIPIDRAKELVLVELNGSK